MAMVLIDISHLNTFVSRRLVTNVLLSSLSAIKILIPNSSDNLFQSILFKHTKLHFIGTCYNVLINRAKGIIKCQLSNRFQRVLFFL